MKRKGGRGRGDFLLNSGGEKKKNEGGENPGLRIVWEKKGKGKGGFIINPCKGSSVGPRERWKRMDVLNPEKKKKKGKKGDDEILFFCS